MLCFIIVLILISPVLAIAYGYLDRRHRASKSIVESNLPKPMADKLKRIKRERLEGLLSADDQTLIEFSKQTGVTDCSPEYLGNLRKCLKKIYWNKYESLDYELAAASSNRASKGASVVKRGAAGAVIAGPTGAIIGAASAIDKNMKNK